MLAVPVAPRLLLVLPFIPEPESPGFVPDEPEPLVPYVEPEEPDAPVP